ncbi:MAG: hypothetical protein CMJ58_05925 [Planctomycetaceae bacterium]|nr:hypothetical protein [Planctomycetaceae bacterium]
MAAARHDRVRFRLHSNDGEQFRGNREWQQQLPSNQTAPCSPPADVKDQSDEKSSARRRA